MKYYWYKCREASTKAEMEVCIPAANFKRAEEVISTNPRYIPLEYLGWTPVVKEETDKKFVRKFDEEDDKQMTIYDFIKEV